jgi:uncharacterized protein (TIGR03435 family)
MVGEKASFEVASASSARYPAVRTFRWITTNAKTSGGRLSATFQLIVYIGFAYKLETWQYKDAFEHLPKWAEDDFFSIDAEAEGDPTKDQMRIMMQSLLTERFNLRLHLETRDSPVLALTLVRPGREGLNLQPHSEGPPCPGTFAMTDAKLFKADSFPSNCESGASYFDGGKWPVSYRDIPAT